MRWVNQDIAPRFGFCRWHLIDANDNFLAVMDHNTDPRMATTRSRVWEFRIFGEKGVGFRSFPRGGRWSLERRQIYVQTLARML